MFAHASGKPAQVHKRSGKMNACGGHALVRGLAKVYFLCWGSTSQVVSSAPARADKTQSVSPVWVAISLVVACVAGIITGGAAALRKLGMSQSSFVCWHFHPDDNNNINKSMATFQLKTFRPACVSFWQLVSAKVERSAY